jgi:hypothetical protein
LIDTNTLEDVAFIEPPNPANAEDPIRNTFFPNVPSTPFPGNSLKSVIGELVASFIDFEMSLLKGCVE